MKTDVLLIVTVIGEKIADAGERMLDSQASPVVALCVLYACVGGLFGFMA